jgi:hypothetical protein
VVSQVANQLAPTSRDSSSPRDVSNTGTPSHTSSSESTPSSQCSSPASPYSQLLHHHAPPYSPEVPREVLSTMANYPVNPEPFNLPNFEIEHGGQNRVVRAIVNFFGEPIYAHEQFTIVVDVDGVLHPGDNQGLLQQIMHYLVNELNLHVASTFLHPHRVELIELESPRHHDGLMLGNLHEIDGVQIRFIRHDYALNQRSLPYTRFG